MHKLNVLWIQLSRNMPMETFVLQHKGLRNRCVLLRHWLHASCPLRKLYKLFVVLPYVSSRSAFPEMFCVPRCGLKAHNTCACVCVRLITKDRPDRYTGGK